MAVEKTWMRSRTGNGPASPLRNGSRRLPLTTRRGLPKPGNGPGPPLEPGLSGNFAGIRSPNPFWLASAPPTNSGEQIMRAFDAGWGGAVWKTIGAQVTNTCSRYSSIDWNGQLMYGLNNTEP